MIRPSNEDVRAYRDAHQCSLLEAKNVVTKAALKKAINDVRYGKLDKHEVADILDTLVEKAYNSIY